MHLQKRIDLLVELGYYMRSDDKEWADAKQKAYHENSWFIPEFIQLSIDQICRQFLNKDKLSSWTRTYALPEVNPQPKNIGLVMAGNIPLVGFHDFLCCFISGHRQTIKASSRDRVLLQQLVKQLHALDEETREWIGFADLLKGCDAYIATGSNNSARYFEYYFSRFPNIIRRNRTSVALLTGNESLIELEKLADDVYLYFGLGCRNVTKIYVPAGYDFVPLLESFRKYDYLSEVHKYKNNYDYQLAILLLNKKPYMSNRSLLLTEDPSLFSPISLLHTAFYTDAQLLAEGLKNNQDVQCIVGQGFTPFGEAQNPALSDYADGIDTLQFLHKL